MLSQHQVSKLHVRLLDGFVPHWFCPPRAPTRRHALHASPRAPRAPRSPRAHAPTRPTFSTLPRASRTPRAVSIATSALATSAVPRPQS
jgi:hypothetical protein